MVAARRRIGKEEEEEEEEEERRRSSRSRWLPSIAMAATADDCGKKAQTDEELLPEG